MKLEDHMNDRQAFEMAMFRARLKATKEGRNPTFHEMLHEAQKELEREHAQLVSGESPYAAVASAIMAPASSPSSPEDAASPENAPSPETEPQV